MKKIIFVSILLLIFSTISCSEDEPTNTSAFKKYPTKLNMEWEYNTINVLEYYNSSGFITDSDTNNFGNTIVRIINTNDTIGDYSGLIKFESFDLLTSSQKKYDWYSNSDTALSLIAYTNAGASQPVIPKSNGKRYITDKEFLALIKSPQPGVTLLSNTSLIDSIYFYDVPRQVLSYPLTVGKRWVELIYPFFRERYVDKITINFFNNAGIKCYLIKVYWSNFNIEFNDYISLENGLIRREIIADSIMITDPEHPETDKFGRYSSYSDLVRLIK